MCFAVQVVDRFAWPAELREDLLAPRTHPCLGGTFAMGPAIGWPSLTSSPWTRRCPYLGLSVAIRITSIRMAAAIGDRPGTPPAGVVPFAGDRPLMPGEQRRRLADSLATDTDRAVLCASARAYAMQVRWRRHSATTKQSCHLGPWWRAPGGRAGSAGGLAGGVERGTVEDEPAVSDLAVLDGDVLGAGSAFYRHGLGVVHD
jgi:hypothetical protein